MPPINLTGPNHSDHSPWRSYLIGLLATGLIALVRYSLHDILGSDAPLLLFTIAVMAAAWQGGLLPGLFTSLLSLAVSSYLFLQPTDHFHIESYTDRAQATLFLLVGLCISSLCEALHRHKHRAERALFAAESRRLQLESEILVRARAEESLRASEARLREIFEASPVGLIVVAPDGSIVLANHSTERLFGYSRNELLGQLVEVLLPPRLRSHHPALRNRFFDHPSSRLLTSDNPLLGYRKDGSEFPVEIGLNPVSMESGLHALASILDISQRLHAEEELRQLNAQLEQRVLERTRELQTQSRVLDAILDAIPVAVICADPSGRLTRLNRACEQVWGLAPLSGSIDEYRDWVGYWPATGERVLPHQWAMSRALMHGETCPGELLEIERFGFGDRRFVINSAAPVWGPDGELIAGVVATLDITPRINAESALRESEERFRRCFEDAPIGMALIALDGHFLRVNRALCNLVGYSEPDLLKSNYQSITVPDDHSTQQTQLHSLLVGEVSSIHLEKHYRHQLGHVLTVEVFLTVVRNDRHEPLYLIKQVQDITDRHMAHELVRASLREKETLLREIHHRVKNNLQIISTLLDLQSEHTRDAQTLGLFRDCRDRVRAMALIHERLYRTQDLAHVDFAEYVSLLADHLYRTYKVSSDDIAFEVDIDVQSLALDVAIPCGLLLNELISNCLKHAFNDRSQGWIKVSMHDQAQSVVLSVADNGTGFPPHFDYHNTASFGLQLVSTLVEQLRGQAEWRSHPGAHLTVCFPRVDQA